MNKVETKVFLGMEVRVVNGDYIVLKDMFAALGRVKGDGTWTNEKNKMLYFLEDLGKECDHQTLVVSSKGKKKSREVQEFSCLKLETVPIVLTQFKPTKAKGDEALETWIKFMKFVDDLLVSLDVYKFIVVDKEHQKESIDRICDNDGKPMVANQMVNKIMGELMDIEGSIKKEELKQYQTQTTIDLLEVREYVLEKFANAFEFTGSHKEARDMARKLALKKYPKLQEG